MPRDYQESEDDEIVRKTTLREVKVLRSLKQENIVNLKVSVVMFIVATIIRFGLQIFEKGLSFGHLYS
jgi:hypothetical protein